MFFSEHTVVINFSRNLKRGSPLYRLLSAAT